MRHVKAENILPDYIIQIIQEYIDGEYIYIPRKNGNEKAWGEKNGTRKRLEYRNNNIYNKYLGGSKVKELAREYYLSENSIRRIIRKERMINY